ncbi:MAG: hypothetical protein COB27_008115 [Moritella sp.]|uniref:hypothetical protein n=1 Tax=unclassified Moritella TaxID=2637987 RepID=UPI0001569632|nr:MULTISPECIES: hypothetical protein [unclassified Moritella]EDM66407.1 molybdopterin biosynthesis protein MoeB [Moritella sp. PE36]MBL1416824.1 hypothetical protein [Moritella sp.]
MSKQVIKTLALVGLFSLSSGVANASVVNDAQLIEGDLCVGFDCVNDENFDGELLRLKENNVHIRLIDTSSITQDHESWNIGANDSSNGGNAYLNLEVKSLTQDSLVLSDGTAPLWDCSVLPPIDTGEFIPAGEPFLTPYSCAQVYVFSQTPYAKFSSLNEGGGVTLGVNSQQKSDANSVSVGNSELTRMLVNVAAGIADTDALTQGNLISLVAANQALDELDKLDRKLARIERFVAVLTKFKARFPYFYNFVKKHRLKKLTAATSGL